MTTENDMELFDAVVSAEKGAEISVPATTVDTAPIKQEPVRDDAGKFATKPAEAAQAANADKPAVEADGPVPVAAIQDERRKRQEAERKAELLEARIAALEKPAPATPKAQEQQPASLWEDPDAYLKGQLSPVQQQVAEMREMFMESRAEAVHGADKVAAAKEAASALFGKPEGQQLYQEIMSDGGNPYDNLVKWHAKQTTLATVGNDPQAWLQAELDKKMADPEFLAQAMEKAKAIATPVVQGRSSSAPRVNLPSLSNIPASGGANVAADGQSDADLFTSITSARRR